MDVGLILVVLLTMAATLSLTWIGFKAVQAWKEWKRGQEMKWSRVNENFSTIYDRLSTLESSGNRSIGFLQKQMIRYSDATKAIQEQLKNATVLNVNAKTGVFTHSDESESAAERACVMGEPTVISAPKNGAKRYEFLEPGGVDAFDRPTKEQVSENVQSETAE